VHVGDEMIEVNRQCVVGWKYATVVKKMETAAREGTHGGYELEITLCKRPRESWINLTLQKPRATSPNTDKAEQKKAVRDFKRKIQPDLLTRQSSPSPDVG
jgi:hypothetical protein